MPIPNSSNKNKIITHGSVIQSFDNIILAIKKQLATNKDIEEREVQLSLLEHLCDFELGRFLLTNKGLNGYWTNYILTYPHKPKNNDISSLEKMFLEKLPTMCATQERFDIFLHLNQQQVKNGAKLASIPSGLGGELFYLDLSKNSALELYLIDLDDLSLDGARLLANEKNVRHKVHYLQENAWEIQYRNEFDLISSNGITIYEPDDNRVIELFQNFYTALTSGGMLVTSSLTPPPSVDKASEWDMSQINLEMLQLQKILFSDIIQVTWQCFRSSTRIVEMLKSVGFIDIMVDYDAARIFPTISAKKP